MLNKQDQDLIYTLTENLIGVSQKGQYRKDILVRNVENRMSACEIKSLKDYLVYANNSRREFAHLVSSLTIHTTSWFREKPHFDKLEADIISRIDQFRYKSLEVLSVPCSTGQEVFSLGMMLEHIRSQYEFFDYRILGEDIDPLSVKKAENAVFRADSIEEIPAQYRKYLKVGSGKLRGYFTVCQQIRGKCEFRVRSLLNKEGFENNLYDVIFCRNVLIYFSEDRVQKIVDSLAERLKERGVLSLGHSEALIDYKDYGLELVWNSSYRVANQITQAAQAAKKKNILVVDDSATVRKVLERMLKRNFFNVFTASGPSEAEEILKKEKVDLISLDLHMPEKDGNVWLKEIRERRVKTPVIIITEVNPNEAIEVLGVLESGAQDYLNKSALDKDEVDIINRMNAIIGSGQGSLPASSAKGIGQKLFKPDLILIGASTGGTEALSILLQNFPKDAPPVVVVQHISPSFAEPFAQRLASVSGLECGKSEEGTFLESGKIYLAHGDYHIGVKKVASKYQLVVSNAPPVNRHRPSVDCLFRSAKDFGNKIGAFILTGMGNDGAFGMLGLKEKGAMTFAQDETSCVVFGMPREAIAMGGVGVIGNLTELRKQMEILIKLKE